MRTQFIRIAVIATLLPFSVLAQEGIDRTKANRGVGNSEYLATILRGQRDKSSLKSPNTTQGYMDSLFTAFMQSTHAPGLGACITNDTGIVWEGYYGYANMSAQAPVDTGTIFYLASVSKTVTASALMQLCEHGRFQLDDSINAYLPFPVRNPYFPSAAITFRHLLTHSSSILSPTLGPVFWGTDPPIALGSYLKEYLTPGGSYYSSGNYSNSQPPGAASVYSNDGISLCGYLVEVISGRPFELYCRDSIFVPLGMTNTAWFLRDIDQSRLARAYRWTGAYHYDNGFFSFASYPCGTLRTTVRSLAKWLVTNTNFGRLGNVRVLDSATVRLMRTVQYWMPNGTGVGLVWRTWQSPDGRWVWWHDGGLSYGVHTEIDLDEAKKWGVTILSNVNPIDIDLWDSFFVTLYPIADALVTGLAVANDSALPARFLLSQNYPNPFNPSTTIEYELPTSSMVRLSVYDMLGREVAVLLDERRDAGLHDVTFDGSGLSSGVYLYRLQAGEFVQTRKLLLVK